MTSEPSTRRWLICRAEILCMGGCWISSFLEAASCKNPRGCIFTTMMDGTGRNDKLWQTMRPELRRWGIRSTHAESVDSLRRAVNISYICIFLSSIEILKYIQCIYIYIPTSLQNPLPLGLPDLFFKNNPFYFSKAFGYGKLRVNYRKLWANYG